MKNSRRNFLEKSLLTALFIFNVFHQAISQNFVSGDLKGVSVANPTSLQFGPDGRLYVAQQDGRIKVFTIQQNASNDYSVTATEIIDLVKKIPNHYDDGTPKPYNANTNKRQVTGLLVAGTSSNPVIFVASSDNDIGAGSEGDKNLCTNSGIISKLYKQGNTWVKIDIVRGLPRSEENHAPNGMQLDATDSTLYIAIGGFTNAGGVSKMWTYITEYTYSSAILSVDLKAITAMGVKDDGNNDYMYDMPTLNDPTRADVSPGVDQNDPWGGNDGYNQAKIDPNGPVQIFASGFRNPYDILITTDRKFYTIDNGPNGTWGGYPVNEGTPNVTNEYDPTEPGSTQPDSKGNGVVANNDGLEFIGNLDTYVPGSYYGGHPNPIRANPAGAGLYNDNGTVAGWRNNNNDPNLPLPSDWPPVPVNMADPRQGDYLSPGKDDQSLITFDVSTNGFCEYKATGSMQGDLLAAGFDGNIYWIKLDGNGAVQNNMNTSNHKLNTDPPLFTGFGNKCLDVTAQGDTDPFPGTIWVANYGSNTITIFEPINNTGCTGADNNSDEDGDGYTNADELDNNTNPCSAASKPRDWDKDDVSDLNDNDDDNDGITDEQDLFCLDKDNGTTTSIPTHYSLFNNDPGTGFYGLGFFGLMSNGTTDYLDFYDESNLVAGGAVGAFTVYGVGSGSPATNDQAYGFQFGVNTATTNGMYTVKAGLLGPFFNQNPKPGQSHGFFIGKGDQDNYLELSLTSNGIEVVQEVGGSATTTNYSIGGMPSGTLILYLVVDPNAGTVQPYYSKDNGAITTLGTPITVTGELLNSINGILAVGAIASSGNSGTPFDATWDYFTVTPGKDLSTVQATQAAANLMEAEVFPNPFIEFVNVSMTFDKNEKVRLRLFDSKGNYLQEQQIKVKKGQHVEQLNFAELDPGIYFINILDADGQHLRSFKIVKN